MSLYHSNQSCRPLRVGASAVPTVTCKTKAVVTRHDDRQSAPRVLWKSWAQPIKSRIAQGISLITRVLELTVVQYVGDKGSHLFSQYTISGQLNNDLISMADYKPHREPIAICGAALKLPGGINTTESLWEALRHGRDMRGPVPESRYCVDGFDAALGGKGAIETRHGYFLDQDLACFDSSRFSLTEEEIKKTDPQQRLLLEVVQECFENAGETGYRGQSIGCYVGTFGEDWLQSLSKEQQHRRGYVMTGAVDLMLANRISFDNDLRGPSMVIKTGCSASLVALHEACRALQMHDCNGAIVAGSNLILGPTSTAAMTSEGILSPEGSCKSFDSKADGFARGEAVTAVYLLRLDRAIQRGLTVRAVITNTGTNCDGQSQGLLQPSAIAQCELMRKVHGEIDSRPARTAFVECHGTGTPIGDPIEARAVGEVFGQRGVYIGSVKPNLGHSEGASGLTSLLKSLVMLEKCMIIPNIKFTSPNPNIDFERTRLQVPTELIPWPRERDLRVAINSFGIGGSNVHVIVEHPYGHLCGRASVNTMKPSSPQLLLMSANTKASLQTLVALHKSYAVANPDLLQDLSYTLGRRREQHQHRTFALSAEHTLSESAPSMKAPIIAPGITMVFSGQGAQWATMGHELLQQNPVFARAIRDMDEILQSLQHPPKWLIHAELQKTPDLSKVNQAELAQPLCTALQIALVVALRSGGVEPSAVVGHSSGEIAAAYATGAIAMDEAITVAYYRGLVTRKQTLGGCMAAIELDPLTITSLLRPGVVIACENSPTSTTISGDVGAVEQVLAAIKSKHKDASCRVLKVDLAYHSHHMKDLSIAYKTLMQAEFELTPRTNKFQKVPLFSSVSNKTITSADSFSSDYWISNLVSPVQFSAAIKKALQEQGSNLFLEIGPHSTLAGPIRQICSSLGVPHAYCPTLVRHSHSTSSLLSAFGWLYQHGIEINRDSLIPDGTLLTDLPIYPWDHSVSYWYESRATKAWRQRKFGNHVLLGLRIQETTDTHPVWRVILSIEDAPWLADHKVKGETVFPFAAYVSMVGEAFRQISGVSEGFSIRSMTVFVGMVLEDEKTLEIVTSLQAHGGNSTKLADETFDFTISSYTGSSWIQHCKGEIGRPTSNPEARDAIGPLPRHVSLKAWYGAMARAGIAFGPEFRRIKNLTASTTQMLASGTIQGPSEDKSTQFALHPTVIDASFQISIAAMVKGLCREVGQPQIPTEIRELDVWHCATDIECTALYEVSTGEVSIRCVGNGGRPCLRLSGMQLTLLGGDEPSSKTDVHAAAVLEWIPDYEFLNVSSLVKATASRAHERQIIEEYVLLCIAESYDRLQNLTPAQPFFVKYRAWLQRIMVEARADQHPVIKDTRTLLSLSPNDRQLKREGLYEEIASLPLLAAFAKGIARVYDNIEDIFTGQVDILELLTKDSALASIYNAVSFDYRDFISALSDSVPTLRILEVGAGTGATTELILRGMQHSEQHPRYGKYTFTDVSAGFFPKAQQRFSGAPNMDFKVFDISRNPVEQGFELGSYDLILATNVIHATSDLVQTLSHLSVLLAPGGRLMLTEYSTQFHAPNYIFGNFSGWWLGEADGREWEPYVGVKRWERDLRVAGFTGTIDTVLDAHEPWQYCATIVAQRLVEDGTVANGVSILCGDPKNPINQGLFERLKEAGLSPGFVAMADMSSIPGDCIATFDLEDSFFENIDQERFILFQHLCRNLRANRLLWLMLPTQIKCSDLRGGQSLGVIRTARAELDLLITTLEIDPIGPDFTRLVCDVFQKVRCREIGSLAPDREYAVNDGVIKVGRYRPFRVHRTVMHDPQNSNGSSAISKAQCMHLDPQATYMLTGGLGGLGRAIAVWLAERGARHLLFLSPRAGTKTVDHELLVELESMGCSMVAVQGLAQSETDVRRCAEAAKAPIKGVMHLAMVLRDALLLDMSYDDWKAVVSPKVDGVRNLHKVLGGSLDFFLMMSSLSTVLYQPGQSNYNAANTFLEAFCQYRHSLGLPASVVDVSPIEGIGFVAENNDAHRKLTAQGHWFLDERALLEVLELAVLRSRPWEVHCIGDDLSRTWTNYAHLVMGLRSETALDDASNRVTWRRDRRMGSYHNVREQKPLQGLEKSNELKEFLLRAQGHPELLGETSSTRYLAGEIGKKLLAFTMRQTDMEEEMTVDLSLSLSQMGLDSLMGIELQRWWKQISGVEMNLLEMMYSGNLAGLGEIAAAGLRKRLSGGI